MFDPPSHLLDERGVEVPNIKTNKDLVDLLSRYKLQLDLSNDDKKVLKMYINKQKEDKEFLQNKFNKDNR